MTDIPDKEPTKKAPSGADLASVKRTPSIPQADNLREAIIDAIDDRRFDDNFPSLLYKDIEWLVDNCLLALFQAREQQLLVELLGWGVQAERASYLPADHTLQDRTTNWPIITEPVYIIPVAVIKQRMGRHDGDSE